MIQLNLKAVQLPSTQNIDKIVKTRSRFRQQVNKLWQSENQNNESSQKQKNHSQNYSQQLDKDFHLQVY